MSGLVTCVAVAAAAQVHPRVVPVPGGSSLFPQEAGAGGAGSLEDLTPDGPELLVLQIAAAAVLAVAIALLIRALAGSLRDAIRGSASRGGRPGRPVAFPAADPAAALAEAASVAADDLRRAASGRMDPAEAVVRAWVRVESVAAELGIPRRDTQTATEFTATLLRNRMVDPSAVGTLLDIYGAARFGTDPLAPADLQTAQTAFRAVHRELADRAAP